MTSLEEISRELSTVAGRTVQGRVVILSKPSASGSQEPLATREGPLHVHEGAGGIIIEERDFTLVVTDRPHWKVRSEEEPPCLVAIGEVTSSYSSENGGEVRLYLQEEGS